MVIKKEKIGLFLCGGVPPHFFLKKFEKSNKKVLTRGFECGNIIGRPKKWGVRVYAVKSGIRE